MLIGGIYGQELPIAHAHVGEMIDEPLCVCAERAERSFFRRRNRGDVTEHAHTCIERLLQTLVLMEIDDGGAVGVQCNRYLAIGDGEYLSRDYIGGAGSECVDCCRVRHIPAAVDQDRCRFVGLRIISVVGENVVVECKRSNISRNHKGQFTPNCARIFDHRLEIEVSIARFG